MKIGEYEIRHFEEVSAPVVQVPFVTTSSDSLKTIVEFADFQKGKRAIDLGSGDGRVALELAKHGFLVTGIEHNASLVARSKERATSLGLTNITFLTGDFWTCDLSDFDVVYIYGMGSVMGRLEKKLAGEMHPGARFISNVFTLPHQKIKKTKNNVHLYVY